MALLALAYITMPKEEPTAPSKTPTLSKDYKAKLTTEQKSPISSPTFDFEWTTKYSILYIDAKIGNPTKKPIKDMNIHCYFYSKSGTLLGRQYKTIYDIVPANSKKTFKHFRMGFIHSQTNSIECSLTKY